MASETETEKLDANEIDVVRVPVNFEVLLRKVMVEVAVGVGADLDADSFAEGDGEVVGDGDAVFVADSACDADAERVELLVEMIELVSVCDVERDLVGGDRDFVYVTLIVFETDPRNIDAVG